MSVTWAYGGAVGLCLVSCALHLSSQTAKKGTTAPAPSPVTINMPEGMTKDQADAILNELRQIRQLLEKQQTTATVPTQPAAAADKVSMSVDKGWHALGRGDAPVTMVEFTDYQCPFCRQYQTDTFGALKKNYIDTGRVRFISRDLPLEFHPHAQKAAEAARCAGEQNKYWELRDTLIANATDLSPDAILRYAQANSLDMIAFQACFNGDKYKGEIAKDTADAGTLGISGTPSFVIGKTSKDTLVGDLVVGAVPIAVFDSEIKKFLTSTP